MQLSDANETVPISKMRITAHFKRACIALLSESFIEIATPLQWHQLRPIVEPDIRVVFLGGLGYTDVSASKIEWC